MNTRRRCKAAALLVLAGVASTSAMAAESPAVRALPVPRETIYPGEVVTAQRLTERRFQTTAQSLAGIATSSTDIIGKEARRRFAAGQPVALGGLATPLAVRRGMAGVAAYREEGFSISMPVIALSDGAEGDIIDARAMETGTVIRVRILPGSELVVLGE